MDSDAEDDALGFGDMGLTTSSESAEYQRKTASSSSVTQQKSKRPDRGLIGALSSSSEEEDAIPDGRKPDVHITSYDDAFIEPSYLTARSRAVPQHGEDPASFDNTYSGLQTPGPTFPHQLHTPIGTPPDLEVESTVTPQERLQWHAMLQSTLRSEVLKSETKRITSADAPTQTREQLMYKRWLDIRASLRGRGHQRGAAEAEEKRLNEGWSVLVNHVVAAVKGCRADVSGGKQKQHLGSSSEDTDLPHDEKEAVIEEVGKVLALVDDAEEQFPSMRKMVEQMPGWADQGLRQKLDALYSWYNVTTSLRLQIKILQEWTGSEALDVQSRGRNGAGDEAQPENESQSVRNDLEGGTFLDRMLKENSLQSTFEKRTLRTLSQLILKAKDAIIKHHRAFSDMALPSFELELVQLINFPTRLMEGALRVRLDYVGKLTDPSVLIVDSLIDDLRSAIALACRVKLQYTTMTQPDVKNGWDLPPCIGSNYDGVLREALQYFFKLLNYKLKGSLFFKETEILEPEWRFLSTAVEVIEGADVLVAQSITRIVNKLFIRIVRYFERELSAPSTRRPLVNPNDVPGQVVPAISTVASGAPRGPSVAGGLTKGQVKMTLEEKGRWIHQVFDSVRIRSRKLLYFSRDIRNRLENAAEYDLSTLWSSVSDPMATLSAAGNATHDGVLDSDESIPTNASSQGPTASRVRTSTSMSLTQFLQTLIDAGYFLVLTGTFEAEGIYLIAEPSLHDKPEMVQELFTKCMRRSRPLSDDMASSFDVPRTSEQPMLHFPEDSSKDEDSDGPGIAGVGGLGKARRPLQPSADDAEPRYLLMLTPRDAFMWTGKVMYLEMETVDVNLKERRLRLIADGPLARLEKCKRHLYNIFGADYASVSTQVEDEDNVEDGRLHRAKRRPSVVKNGQAFPLDIVDESLAHMSKVQSELRRINKGIYMLSDSVIRSVPKIRRRMRGKRGDRLSRADSKAAAAHAGKGGDIDELIQNSFSMASDQGYRSMPFIESARLRGQMTLSLARLAIDWVAFICDDCEPSDRKTFKWAVAALENAMYVTRSEDILHISEEDFLMMRRKVASCVGLLISHFDILGARSSVAKAKEEEERLQRERAERSRAIDAAANLGDSAMKHEVAQLVTGSGAGAPPMLNRIDSGMQATEERWVQKGMEWDAARQSIESEQRLIGRVLDDTRLEDRGLQFLASSSSRIQIRWQQGRYVGSGTFGTVYLAVNLDSGGVMAVKEIRFQDINSTPSMYKQIKDEMSVMEMLSHPNIVEYYGIEVHRDKVYIFEEYCQGGSLAQLLEHGRIEDEMVMQVYTLQMLDGLVYLHSKGVVHRDIKPDNILLDHLGVIKFVDFGAAKVLAKNSRTIQRSRKPGGGGVGPQAMGGMLGPDGKPAAAASLQGTPMYMSPEVIKGETRGRRGAMDVWSLGCVVLEFATGHRPWSQLDNEWAIMFHIGMAQQHPPLPEPGQLSEMGIDFIRNCLVIDPYERPSAEEMREHAWIKNLVDALNAANEEEAAAAAMNEEAGTLTRQSSGYGGDSSASAGLGSSSSNSLAGGSFVHREDSAAGVAAMAATPGTRSINGFNFGRPAAPSFNSNASSFSRLSLESGVPRAQAGSATVSVPSTSSAEVVKDIPAHHQPGHPNHTHPGYDALVADLAYRREEEEKRRMISRTESGLDEI
jgi:mitogen-activated protein kinase kinase kinase